MNWREMMMRPGMGHMGNDWRIGSVQVVDWLERNEDHKDGEEID